MSATSSSTHFRVLLHRCRKPASSLSSYYGMCRVVSHYSIRRSSIAAFSTSSTSRNLEKLGLGHASEPSALLYPNVNSPPLQVVAAKGTTVKFSNGKTIEDTTCGAAVACLGYDNDRVQAAMTKQIANFSYSNSMFYGHSVSEELAAELLSGTRGKMDKVYLMCSGTSSRCYLKQDLTV